MITVKMGGGSSLKLIANAIGDPATQKDKKEKLAEIIDNAQTDIAELCNERGCSIPAHPTFPQIIGGISKLTHFTKPAQVSGLRSVGNHDIANKIDLFWNNPSGDSNFRGVKILYKTGGYPTSATDGTVAYDGTGTSAYLTNMAHGTTYYFRAFSYSSVDGGFVYNDLASGAQCTGVSTLNTSAQITGLRATVGSTTSGYVKLTWANPSDSKFKGVRILYKTGGYPSSVTDGTVLYTGTGTSVEKTGLANGTTYYFRAFAYNLSNNIYSYNTGTSGAQCSEVPFISRGQQVFTASGTFTVPARVSRIDVFLVGGGSGGQWGKNRYGGGGGGAGYTKTIKSMAVTPGQQISAIVGAGGSGGIPWPNYTAAGNGGQSSFGGNAASGGTIKLRIEASGASYPMNGGNGGSGGGMGGNTAGSSVNNYAGYGGSNGSNGYQAYYNGGNNHIIPSGEVVGIGQGTTTRAFGETSNTLYAGGGGGGVADKTDASSADIALGGAGGGGKGGWYDLDKNSGISGSAGTPNTGGGGGGGDGWSIHVNNYLTRNGGNGGNGGSGIVIVRWGY